MPFLTGKRYDFWDTGWREVGAVYGVLNASGRVIYVGQTGNLNERMAAHRTDGDHCMHRCAPTHVIVEVIELERERLLRERALISEYDPPCNKM